ncbi:hypothetical protein [uncultured Brevibacillus sp.]|uniref:hypothetical protein n=1 Tax=uncultured Brevibacillus sp. TaxID=169970 RepID=UPI00259959DC|nr:hypothetical protein [uncultured Brevibacillus sp.]
MFGKNDLYLSATQAANALGISKEEVYKLEAEGKLIGFRIAPNDSRATFSMREINRFKKFIQSEDVPLDFRTSLYHFFSASEDLVTELLEKQEEHGVELTEKERLFIEKFGDFEEVIQLSRTKPDSE